CRYPAMSRKAFPARWSVRLTFVLSRVVLPHVWTLCPVSLEPRLRGPAWLPCRSAGPVDYFPKRFGVDAACRRRRPTRVGPCALGFDAAVADRSVPHAGPCPGRNRGRATDVPSGPARAPVPAAGQRFLRMARHDAQAAVLVDSGGGLD